MSFPTSSQHAQSSLSLESIQPCRQFTFSEIQLATHDFDESLVIGRGGFGTVYKGTVSNGSSRADAAIKRLESASNQGAHEFWAEVKMLSKLRHCHLVSLIGYCNDGQEMILIYEYMPNGTLADRLHKCLTLTWVRRLKICIGAARGLDYLHTGTGINHGVIHRDVKSSNILVDINWAAKISDFGLSKIGPTNLPSTTYVNTMVRGTFGYLDPNYFYTGKLTRKSDVYAFGVVLFEVLCGKKAVDTSIDEEQCSLAAWAHDSIKEGRVKQIVDVNIRGSISSKCLKEFARLADRCLHSSPQQRPTMAQVVTGLESILASQDKANQILSPLDMKIFGKMAPTFLFPSSREKSVERRNLLSLEMFLRTVGGENQMLRKFDFDTISDATENFSVANKISGNGPHGYIYKGKLKNGQDIAIFGPPELSSHRNNQCINEVSILVQIEHKNLIQLLGYCIEGTDTYLIYDFAPYATLSSLLFDPDCALLGWDERYKIVLGVARALVYLQQHAPSRIIHCDVNRSNILLDEQMNPKLSNFKFARRYTKTHEDDLCETTQVAGTMGHMAPEYLIHGHLSAKTDVYSFGVVVLETLCGHRVLKDNNKRLLEFVWSNWAEGTYSNILDPRLNINADSTFMKRFIQIGLLCVQIDRKDRPTMEEVVCILLGTLTIDLPVPKQPVHSGNNLDDGEEEIYPINAHYSTDEEFEGR